ncbi:hypothetical protein [Dyella sp. ASV21]|nr:hypothetical protein [Dyella sp. ASV21]
MRRTLLLLPLCSVVGLADCTGVAGCTGCLLYTYDAADDNVRV